MAADREWMLSEAKGSRAALAGYGAAAIMNAREPRTCIGMWLCWVIQTSTSWVRRNPYPWSPQLVLQNTTPETKMAAVLRPRVDAQGPLELPQRENSNSCWL